MTVGITMLKVLPGHEIEASCFLKKMENVKEVYRVSGEYNLLLIIAADDQIALYRLINSIKEDPVVTGIWHLLVTKEDGIFNDGESYLNWLKTHSNITVC